MLALKFDLLFDELTLVGHYLLFHLLQQPIQLLTLLRQLVQDNLIVVDFSHVELAAILPLILKIILQQSLLLAAPPLRFGPILEIIIEFGTVLPLEILLIQMQRIKYVRTLLRTQPIGIGVLANIHIGILLLLRGFFGLLDLVLIDLFFRLLNFHLLQLRLGLFVSGASAHPAKSSIYNP